MTRILLPPLALAGALAVAGCQRSQQTGTLAGGAIGAGTGALIGSAVSGGSAGGTIAGGVIGAGTGALVGHHVTRPRHQCVRWHRNSAGHRVCTAWR
jgi:hypothetical protein